MSRIIELIGCIIVSILSKDIKFDLRFMFIRNKLLFSDFVRLSLPALGNDLSWSVAFSMYSVILGHLGSDAVAANSIVVVVSNIGSVLCFGVANACGIMLGNVMGEGNLEKAKDYASRLLKLTVITGAIGGVIVLAITPFVLKLPVMWVYFLLCTDEFVKWPWVLKRYKSGKWAKNITRDNLFEDEAKEQA